MVVVAKFAFAGTGPNQLAVQAGDELSIVDENVGAGGGWTFVRRLGDGGAGYVPSEYLEEVPESVGARPTQDATARRIPEASPSLSSSQDIPGRRQPETTSLSSQDLPGRRQPEATFSYRPGESGPAEAVPTQSLVSRREDPPWRAGSADSVQRLGLDNSISSTRSLAARDAPPRPQGAASIVSGVSLSAPGLSSGVSLSAPGLSGGGFAMRQLGFTNSQGGVVEQEMAEVSRPYHSGFQTQPYVSAQEPRQISPTPTPRRVHFSEQNSVRSISPPSQQELSPLSPPHPGFSVAGFQSSPARNAPPSPPRGVAQFESGPVAAPPSHLSPTQLRSNKDKRSQEAKNSRKAQFLALLLMALCFIGGITFIVLGFALYDKDDCEEECKLQNPRLEKCEDDCPGAKVWMEILGAVLLACALLPAIVWLLKKFEAKRALAPPELTVGELAPDRIIVA